MSSAALARHSRKVSMTTVLTIDQGTSGTKAIVVDGDGNLLGLSEHPVRPVYLPAGGVEQDPHELLASVLGAGRAAMAKAGVPIDIVTVANQGETVLAWDPDTGRPLSKMIVWQDRRAESICAELAEHKETFARRTGLVLDPYFSAPKQAWLRRNVTRDGVVTTSDSWLIHQLTHEFVTDANYVVAPSDACPRLVNVAAIRSTGLTASLGIGSYVAELLPALGVQLGSERAPDPAPARPPADISWWQRTERHHGVA
jgi:sugar (pentulose or hexulose) kinase